VKPNEAREKSMIDLEKKTSELQEELFHLQFKKTSGQLTQTSNIKKTRKELAVIKTVMQEKKCELKRELS